MIGRPRTWTDPRLAEARRLYVEQGLTAAQTAAHLGVTERAIKSLAGKQRWARPRAHWLLNVAAGARATHCGRVRPPASGKQRRPMPPHLSRWTGWFLAAGWPPREVAQLFRLDPKILSTILSAREAA
jgi:hypothetical protein